MLLSDAIWDLFDKQLFPVASCPKTGLFNPYNSVDASLDRGRADIIRRQNLRQYVDCFVHPPAFVMIGEAPGWRGCRMSGVPFTSEEQLVSGILPFSGRQSCSAAHPYSENSANHVWAVLKELHPDVFVWNAVPLHPHQKGNLKTNRKPTTAERRRFEALTDELIRILKPTVVIAIGRVAEQALKAHRPKYVRHPSNGGAPKFEKGVAALRRGQIP